MERILRIQKGGAKMSKKPVLVVMAAGMGSRYGGLKQIDPVDEYGNIIMDFSIYDAVEAGFEKVVFIIKKAIEKEFMEHIGKRMEKHVLFYRLFCNGFLHIQFHLKPGNGAVFHRWPFDAAAGAAVHLDKAAVNLAPHHALT